MAGDSEKLTLQVKDFGPIAEGEVDLRPLTVFIGPSNTGKSYLATLIYALHRFFSEDQGLSIYGLSFPSILYQGQGRVDISDKQAIRLFKWASEIYMEFRRSSPNSKIEWEIPGDIADMIRPCLRPDKEWFDPIGEEIIRFYGFKSIDALARYPGDASAEVSLQRHVGQELLLEYRFNIEGGKPSMTASIPETTHLRFDTLPVFRIYHRFTNSADNSKDTIRERMSNARYFIGMLAEAVSPYVTGSMGRPVHYLPAARTGAMRTLDVMINVMIERETIARIHPSPQLPALNGVLADFLTTLMRINRLQLPSASGVEVAKSIEKNVLRGSVNLKESSVPNMYPSFVYRPDGWDRDLPLMNTASMISELAPLVLYLRYVVQPGDTLIIEEPEAHLHPEMQAAVIRELTKAVHAGVRIIITTHSEWIMEALENIALASKLPEDKRGGVSLKPEDLGVWTFQHEKEAGGSVVKELPFDPEIGFDTEDYSQVAADLHNHWANISSKIERNDTQ